MFCPECGVVVGPEPLDIRHARHGCGDGIVKSIGRWIIAAIGGRGSERARRHGLSES